MWFLFPKLRWLWFLLAFLVVVGQIGMYYHFLSDVIAGALLGSLVGFYIIRRKDVQ
jgi:membrane-associated phospholipid phosphatase